MRLEPNKRYVGEGARVTLERVQVSNQLFNLLVAHDLAETFHFGSPVLDDIDDTVVIGRQPAQRKILILKHALEAGTLLAMR